MTKTKCTYEFLWHLEVIFMVPISEASGMCSDNTLANKVITVKTHFIFLMLFLFGQSIFQIKPSKLWKYFPKFWVVNHICEKKNWPDRNLQKWINWQKLSTSVENWQNVSKNLGFMPQNWLLDTPWAWTIRTQQSFLHCNPLQGQYRARTGFSLCSISTQGKTYFHYRDPS